MVDKTEKSTQTGKSNPPKSEIKPISKQLQKPAQKMPPEEEVKHIPKSVIEERFLSGHYQQPHKKIGQRAADLTTRWVGSWSFIIILFIIMAIWMSVNLYLIFSLQWDPYPFILLNFVLSCLAAIQEPIILMSQNRQTEMDRMKAERDFAVNRKAEKEVENIQHDLEVIKRMIHKLIKHKQFKPKPKQLAKQKPMKTTLAQNPVQSNTQQTS